MKRPLLLILCAAIFAVTSCRKINRPDEAEANFCFLTKSTLKTNGDDEVSLMTYNKAGFVTTARSSVGVQLNYTYFDGKITTTFSAPGEASVTTTQTLDSKGRVISEIDLIGNTTEYLYNSDGYLIEIKTIYPTGTSTVKLNYTDGNLTTVIDGQNLTTITYGTEPANPNLMITGDIEGYPDLFREPLKKFYGKLSKNLFTKISHSYTDSYDTFTYQKDSRGNVLKVTAASIPEDTDRAFELNSEYTCQ